MKAFATVFFVSIMAYGMFMTSLLFPDAKLDENILFQILFRPYLLIFGDPGTESYAIGSSTTIFGTSRVRPLSEYFVVFVMTIFLFFLNILLMNLLIAEFSHEHEKAVEKSEEIWRYQDYLLLQEFKSKPKVPIPFSIPVNTYDLLQKLASGMKNVDRSPSSSGQHSSEDKKKEEKRKKFERFCFHELYPEIPEDIV